jgi:hypothetical protein
MEKSKETTARVVLRKEFGILNSFTLESTYCGMDNGDKKGFQIQIADLEKAGVAFGKTVYQLMNSQEMQVLNLQVGELSVLTTPSSGSSLNNTPKRTRKPRKNTKVVSAKKKVGKPKELKVKDGKESGCSSDDDDDDGE